jgi:hypothetical protein
VGPQNDGRGQEKAMFGWIKTIFSTGKGVEAGIELAKDLSRGVDALFFTNEEKEKYRQEVAKLWLDAMEKTANENTARSITRRILAVLVLTQYNVFLYLMAVIYPFNADWAAFIYKLVEQSWIVVLTVIAFYFGPYFISYLFTGGKDGTRTK